MTRTSMPCVMMPPSRRWSPDARAAFSAHEAARVAEQAHPAAVFPRRTRPPGILHVAERALRVRHADGHAAIEVRERRDAEGSAARILRVTHGNIPVVADVAEAHQTALRARARRLLRGKLRTPLAVRNRPRQERARHASDHD